MLELEEPRYTEVNDNKEELHISYIINPSKEDLFELTKHTNSYKNGDDKTKKSIEGEIDALYRPEIPEDFDYDWYDELPYAYGVTAVGYADRILLYVGGEPVDSDYDTTELMKQHKKMWEEYTKDEQNLASDEDADANRCVGLDYKKKLFYAPQYDAHNLYFVLYYELYDSNRDHFAWRRDSEVSSWSREECLKEIIKFLEHIDKENPLGVLNKFCQETLLPKSLDKAIEDASKMLQNETTETPPASKIDAARELTSSDEMLFYAPQYDAENLYFVLYYCYCDASIKHFAYRRDPQVCEWDRDECLTNAVDILRYANEENPLGELETFCEENSLPKSLNKAIEDAKKLLRAE